MDIRERIANAKSPEEMEKYLLDLDSEFRFKCRRCGKCCKNQDTILFNARDIYNIAKKIGKTPKKVIEECAEVYIGDSSRIPAVHMVPASRDVARCCCRTADAAFTTVSPPCAPCIPWAVWPFSKMLRTKMPKSPGRISG